MKKTIFALLLFLLLAGTAQASLYSYYQEQGQKLPSIAQRVVLASSYGISGYRGTAAQNTALEAYLRGSQVNLLGGSTSTVPTPSPKLNSTNTWAGWNYFNGNSYLNNETYLNADTYFNSKAYNFSNNFYMNVNSTSSANTAFYVLSTPAADGGVTYDNATMSYWAGSSNPTFSFTVASNSNRFLMVYVHTPGGTPSAVTYNGVAMTLTKTYGYLYLYELIAPATGTHSVNITLASSYGQYAAYSYYNVNQTTPIDASSTASTFGTSLATNLLTLTNGSVVVTAATQYGNPLASLVSSIGMNNHRNIMNSSFLPVSGGGLMIGDSGQLYPTQLWNIQANTDANANILALKTALIPTASAGFIASPASAAQTSTCNTYVGFSVASTSPSYLNVMAVGGILGGFSGLQSNAVYYLSNTTGTISTVAGSTTKEVGIAISPTQLLLK